MRERENAYVYLLWKTVRILPLFLPAAMTRSASSELTVNGFSTTTLSKVSPKTFFVKVCIVKLFSSTYHVYQLAMLSPQTRHAYYDLCIRLQAQCSCRRRIRPQFDNASPLESRQCNAFLSRRLLCLLALRLAVGRRRLSSRDLEG